jgi:hypothetical protein
MKWNLDYFVEDSLRLEDIHVQGYLDCSSSISYRGSRDSYAENSSCTQFLCMQVVYCIMLKVSLTAHGNDNNEDPSSGNSSAKIF